MAVQWVYQSCFTFQNGYLLLMGVMEMNQTIKPDKAEGNYRAG